MKDARTIIQQLVLSEKGTALKEKGNQYLFQVDPGANKIEIRRAVEQLFKVKVTDVNTMNRQGKRKRQRTMKYGRTSAWKRAVVTLKAGDTIEVS